MTDQFSIQYISRLLDSPALITEGDRSSVESLLRSYPYLVPLRYIEAAEKRTPHAFSTEMLAKARPYIGNWIKYCDFADAASQAIVVTDLESEGDRYEEQPETPEVQVEREEVPGQVIEPTPGILLTEEPFFAPDPIIEPEPEEIMADEIVAEILHEPVAEPSEPMVKVSEEFLQLIREEPSVIPEPIGIAPRPVFDSADVHNEASDEYEITEDATPTAEPVALHLVTPPFEEPAKETTNDKTAEALISPIYTQDYFLQQGEKISEEIPVEIEDLKESPDTDDVDKSLMVMMSFSEWLLHFKSTTRKHEEEKKDQRALKTMWQKEKLAAVLEEENEEIPENVFEMAVNSIAKEDGLASESLAEIYIKQGKYDKAMDMYRKLSLRNPQKNAYFARKIEEVLKEKQS